MNRVASDKPGQGNTGKQRVGIGILGCSDIARRRFLPAALKAGNATLAVVASRDPAKAQRFCPELQYQAEDYDGLLANGNVDLVYVSLPNHLHEEWVLKALGRGKHVICEKPLALSLESAERMTALARQAGLLLYENIAYLHHPRHQTVKDMITAGEIGRGRGLRRAFGFSLAHNGGYRWDAGRGGGAFLDLVRYPLSAALFFLEGAVYRFDGHAFFRNGLDVALKASAQTERHEDLQFSIGFEQQYECWYEIVGEEGLLRVDRAYTTPADYSTTIQVVRGSGTTSVTVPAADHFQLMLERVCGLIVQGRSYLDLYRDAERLASLAEQVREECDRVNLEEPGASVRQ